MFDPVIVIPVYNHDRALSAMLDELRAVGVPCLLVDDGSDLPCAMALAQMAAANGDWLSLERLPENGGKGHALMAGFALSASRGHSHVVQIDADGQHVVTDIPRFLQAARAHPQALILGQPQFDQSVPRGRLYGRYLTHVWVWINTLSRAIHDSMCGFRVYPLAAVTRLLRENRLGSRMDFDTEVCVRLAWEGLDILNLYTRVRYPEGGVSHFRLWQDNVLISRMHARLFFGMLRRLPRLLRKRPRAIAA